MSARRLCDSDRCWCSWPSCQRVHSTEAFWTICEIRPGLYMRVYGATIEELQEACVREVGTVRTFDTGATRDTAEGKYEYARFFDPRVMRSVAAFMHKHRAQSDGALRAPDNWKKGIPLQTYMDSLFRHVMDLWEIHEHGEAKRPETSEAVDIEETLCAVVFNAMGYMFELQKQKEPKS